MKKIICENCHKLIDESEILCPYCGTKNNSIESQIELDNSYIKKISKDQDLVKKVIFIFIVGILFTICLVGIVTTSQNSSNNNDADIVSSEEEYTNYNNETSDEDKNEGPRAEDKDIFSKNIGVISIKNILEGKKETTEDVYNQKIEKKFMETYIPNYIDVSGIEGNADIEADEDICSSELEKIDYKNRSFFIDCEANNKPLYTVKNGDEIKVILKDSSEKIIATKKFIIKGLEKSDKLVDFSKNLKKGSIDIKGYNGILACVISKDKAYNAMVENKEYLGVKNGDKIHLEPSDSYLNDLRYLKEGVLKNSDLYTVKGLKSISSIKINDRKKLRQKIYKEINFELFNKTVKKMKLEKIYCRNSLYDFSKNTIDIGFDFIFNINNGENYAYLRMSDIKVDLDNDKVINENVLMPEVYEINNNLKKLEIKIKNDNLKLIEIK